MGESHSRRKEESRAQFRRQAMLLARVAADDMLLRPTVKIN
jgi:hypothetical protein